MLTQHTFYLRNRKRKHPLSPSAPKLISTHVRGPLSLSLTRGGGGVGGVKPPLHHDHGGSPGRRAGGQEGWVAGLLRASGRCGGSWLPCCCCAPRGPSGSCRPARLHSHTSGRSPGRGQLSSCAWCTPGLPSAPACRSSTRSDGRSTGPLSSSTSAGNSLPPCLLERPGPR